MCGTLPCLGADAVGEEGEEGRIAQEDVGVGVRSGHHGMPECAAIISSSSIIGTRTVGRRHWGGRGGKGGSKRGLAWPGYLLMRLPNTRRRGSTVSGTALASSSIWTHAIERQFARGTSCTRNTQLHTATFARREIVGGGYEARGELVFHEGPQEGLPVGGDVGQQPQRFYHHLVRLGGTKCTSSHRGQCAMSGGLGWLGVGGHVPGG